MGKYKLARAEVKRNRQGWPSVVYIGIAVFGLTGYVFAEIALGTRPHPLHWLSALVGAVLGYLLGWLWYHWRGDIG